MHSQDVMKPTNRIAFMPPTHVRHTLPQIVLTRHGRQRQPYCKHLPKQHNVHHNVSPLAETPAHPSIWAVEIVAIDIVRPFLEATQGNKYIPVIENQYFKLSWDIPTSRTPATHNTNLFFGHWLIRDSPPKSHAQLQWCSNPQQKFCYNVRPSLC